MPSIHQLPNLSMLSLIIIYRLHINNKMYDSNTNANTEPEQQLDPLVRNLIKTFKLSSLNHEPSSSNNQFTQSKIRYFNDTAVYKIKQEQYKEALMFLKEAEKIMEESMKNKIKVNSIYILCVMQNQVCVYVNLWQLEKAQKYIETLIENIQNQIQISQSKNKLKKLYFNASNPQKQQLKQTISKYTLVANYYIQYSTILSQLQKHQASVQFIKKSIKLIKDICQKMMQLEIVSSKATNGNGRCYGNCVLEYLVSVKEIIDLSIIGEKVKQIVKLLKGINCNEETNYNHKNQKNIKWLRQFDHTNVTEVFAITVQSMERIVHSLEEPTTVAKWQMVIYLSICFFSLATQCRLMAALKYEENRKFTQPFKLSKLFHLQAIQIYAKNIPYDSKYLQNIIESFQSHYQTSLVGVRQDRQDKNNYIQNNRTQSKSFLFDNQMLQASIVNEQSHDFLIQSNVKDQKQQNNGTSHKIRQLENYNKDKQPELKPSGKQQSNHRNKVQPKNKNIISQSYQQKQSEKNKHQKHCRQYDKIPKSNNTKSQKKIISRKSVEIENSSNRFSIYGLNPHDDLKTNLKNKKKSTNEYLKRESKEKMKRSHEERSSHRTKLSRQISNQKQKSTRSHKKNQSSGKVFMKDLNPPTSKRIQQQYMLLSDNRVGQELKNKEDPKNKHKVGQKQSSKEKKQKPKQYCSQQKKTVSKRPGSVKSHKKKLTKNK